MRGTATRKVAPPPGVSVTAMRAVVLLDGLPHDGEAEPGAVALVGEVRLEDHLAPVVGNAGPVVAHGNPTIRPSSRRDGRR